MVKSHGFYAFRIYNLFNVKNCQVSWSDFILFEFTNLFDFFLHLCQVGLNRRRPKQDVQV